ncbi:uncharacterized protein LOC118411278 [Branchiostoma floridae]|uniref:Uncharacterized protein LOC118411278 n=1 Tax=Branchiostoma floridae TaxID=7739 RepID=A0A9J7KRZ7_BRAFL|nr:uncharacterized protein LOC118411278 [Branchiostoma floridae]
MNTVSPSFLFEVTCFFGWDDLVPLNQLLTAFLLGFCATLVVYKWQGDHLKSDATNSNIVSGNGNTCVNIGGSNNTNTVTIKHFKTRKCASNKPALYAPICRSSRLNTKTQASCRRLTDKLAQLSDDGLLKTCQSRIQKMFRGKTKPDFKVVLHLAETLNAINEGSFMRAYTLLNKVEKLLPSTESNVEYTLRWFHLKSLAQLREGKNAGLYLTGKALTLIDQLEPGCLSGWVLILRARLISSLVFEQQEETTEMALSKDAETLFHTAIQHAQNEFPQQMENCQSYIPQFASIGLVFLHMRFWPSLNKPKLGIPKQASPQSLEKVQKILANIDESAQTCHISKLFLMLAKASLQYGLGHDAIGDDLVKSARKLVKKHAYLRLVDCY